MRDELGQALHLAETSPVEELPRLLGDLEEIRATAIARLTTPAAATPPNINLEISEAAHRLGVSPSFLYRHHREFKFTRREGRKLLFSSQGIAEHLRKQR